MSKLTLKESAADGLPDTLHIDKAKGAIDCELTAIKFVDKDTKQHIVYLPTLDITGYGDTEVKAKEMMKFSLDDFCKLIITFTRDQIAAEMRRLGWKQSAFFKKDFSKTYVDEDGNLQNFNAEKDSVERVTLSMVAA